MASFLDALRNGKHKFRTTRIRRTTSEPRYAALTHNDNEEEERTAVDLSDLAGPVEYVQQGLDSSLRPDSAGDEYDRTSYHFPPDPDPPSWRPLVLRPMLIWSTAAIYFLLGTFQEFYFQASRKLNNGHYIGMLPIQFFLIGKLMLAYLIVMMAIMWQVCDVEIKRLEPYHQLARNDGASAEDSLTLDYLTGLGAFVPVKAFRKRHWRVFVSSLASMISTYLVVILQAGALSTKVDKNQDGGFLVDVNPVLSRLVTLCLLSIAFCGLSLWLLLRPRSGLLSDPRGIARTAAMATKSHLLSDFQDLDVSSEREIRWRLSQRRYKLYRGTLWQGEFSHKHDTQERYRTSTWKQWRFRGQSVKTLSVLGFAFYVLFLISFLGPFVMSARQRIQDRLGPKYVPIVLTSLAVIVKAAWSTLDLQFRLMEPFYALVKRNAPPSVLTLDYTVMAPGRLTYKAFKNQHYIVGFVSLGSILIDFLVVCMTCLDVDPRVYNFASFGREGISRSHGPISLLSGWLVALSIATLAYLAATAVCLWWCRRATYLPRHPGSIASVLAYVHQSKLVYDLIGAEDEEPRRLSRRLKAREKRYGFGWFVGRDGQTHCGIDEEPLISNYKHGADYSMSRAAPEPIGSWDHF